MTVISFVNPKGGSGKTTLSLALAEQFAIKDLSVALLDTDPHGFLRKWSEDRPEALGFASFATRWETQSEQVVSAIEEMSAQYDVVLVDTEGRSDMTTTRVISRSHLVLVPLNPKTLDATKANTAVQLIENDAHMLGRKVDYRLIFSRTQNFQTTTLKEIREQTEEAGYPALKSTMPERVIFDDMFKYSATLSEISTEARKDLKISEALKIEREGQGGSLSAQERKSMTKATDTISKCEKAQAAVSAVADEITRIVEEISQREAQKNVG